MPKHFYDAFFTSLLAAAFLAVVFFVGSLYRTHTPPSGVFHPGSNHKNSNAMRNVVRMQPGPLPVSPVSPVALGPRLYQQEVEEEPTE